MEVREVLVDGGPSVAVRRGDDWVALSPLSEDPWARDVLAFLGGGATVREAAAGLIAAATPAPFDPAPRLPFAARSLRAFSIYPAHVEGSARGLVQRFFPKPMSAAVGAFEKATRKTFPALRPSEEFATTPQFYFGNHTAMVPDGATVAWPPYSGFLDFELELGFVLAHEVADCTPQEGLEAIGGFVLINDWSARDTQAHEYRHGMFGPVVKAKSFANGLGATVVTADELLPRADRLRGTVHVNGERWSATSTAGAAHGLGELVAHASRGERLAPGDLFATGTLPNGCGLELDRWVQPGDVVELALEGLGTLTATVGARP